MHKKELEIRKVVYNKTTFRSQSFLDFKEDDLFLLAEIVTDKVKHEVCLSSPKEYNQCWSNRNSKDHRKSTKLDYIVERMIKGLNDSFSLTIKIDSRKGPSYLDEEISMPHISKFNTSKQYYSNLFHEICHAVCSGLITVPTETEEVVVEICALIICITSGVNVWDDCLSYVNSYCTRKSINYKKYWNSIDNKVYKVLFAILRMI
jgi:hypothetical protein